MKRNRMMTQRGRYTNFKVWTYEKCIAFIDGFIWDGFCPVSVQ